MKKAIVVAAVTFLASVQAAPAQQTAIGRYQMVPAPASTSQTLPEVFLLDTATGQTWKLLHDPGQTIQWLPVRYAIGKDRPMTPLPPPPDVVGSSR